MVGLLSAEAGLRGYSRHVKFLVFRTNKSVSNKHETTDFSRFGDLCLCAYERKGKESLIVKVRPSLPLWSVNTSGCGGQGNISTAKDDDEVNIIHR